MPTCPMKEGTDGPRLAAQSSLVSHGVDYLRRHLSRRCRHLVRRDKARGRRPRPRLQGVVAGDAAAAWHHLRSSRRLPRRAGMERFREGEACGLQRSERASLRHYPGAEISQRAGQPITHSVNEHIDIAVNQEWPAMAHQRARLGAVPTKLVEALNATLSLAPEEPGQKLAQ